MKDKILEFLREKTRLKYSFSFNFRKKSNYDLLRQTVQRLSLIVFVKCCIEQFL